MKRIWILVFFLLLCGYSHTHAMSPVRETGPSPAPSAPPTSTPQPMLISITMSSATPAPGVLEPSATPKVTPLVVREDLSARCSFRCTQPDVSQYTFIDNDLGSSYILGDAVRLSYTWEADVPADALYLFAYTLPDAFRLVQTDGQGAVLREEELIPERMCSLVPLEQGCRSVEITCRGRCKLNALQIFGPGNALPEKTVW